MAKWRILSLILKVLQEHKTAIQRQIHEAVMIQNHRGSILMNSKSDFSRCRISRLMVRFGNKDEKNKEEETRRPKTRGGETTW